MKHLPLALLSGVLVAVSWIAGPARGYDLPAHRSLATLGTRASDLDSILKEVLGYDLGALTPFRQGEESRAPEDWVAVQRQRMSQTFGFSTTSIIRSSIGDRQT